MYSAAYAYSTPEAPGPPGFTSNAPRRFFGLVAGYFTKDNCIRSPPGFE